MMSSTEEESGNSLEADKEEEPLEEQLLAAARNGRYDIVKDLCSARQKGQISLDLNCKGNQKFNRGWTSLHLAAYFGHTDVVKILLENGADKDVTNSNGDTAIHKAAYTGRLDVVRVLLDNGADVSYVNSEGQTPRYAARTKEIKDLIEAAETYDNKQRQEEFLSSVREGDVEQIKEMLKNEKKPNLNCRDPFGNSALHIAAQADQKEVAVILLQNGLAPNVKNIKEQTAIDFARSAEMKQILEVRPVKEFTLHPNRCEGILLKKSRFLGFKAVYVVLERGVLSYFKNRGDASTGSRRKGMKYLDRASIMIPRKNDDDNMEFILRYSDDMQHTFSTGDNQQISRQKWLNALKDHVTYSTHYIQQGAQVYDDEEELLPLGSLQETLKTAQAHQKLLEKHVSTFSSSLDSPGGSQNAHQQALKISQMAQEMCTSFSHCLTMFLQQEEVRNLQLKEEMEKSRVLQEALHALATEHHELERSISVRKTSTQRYYDTDEDEFYDCDEESLGNISNGDDVQPKGSFQESDAISFMSVTESPKAGSSSVYGSALQCHQVSFRHLVYFKEVGGLYQGTL